MEWRNKHRLRFVDSSLLTPERQLEWYESYCRHEDNLMYVIETLDERPVGCVSLYDIDRQTGTAEFGRLMIGRPEDEGRGYAADACRALIEHARRAMGLTHLYLRTRTDNEVVLPFYRHLGFSPDPSYDANPEKNGVSVELLGMSLSLSSGAGLDTPAAPVSSRPPINVVVVCPGVTPSTHMRLLSPLAWLADQGLVAMTLVTEPGLRRLHRELVVRVVRGASYHRETRLRAERVLAEADVVVIQRSTGPGGMRAQTLARAGRAAVVYESDDNFLLVDRDTPVVGVYYSEPKVRRSFIRLLTDADMVTTTTEVLADAFRQFSADVRILPSCVDFAHIDTGPRPEPSSGFVIGYAGTVTHDPDFERVEPVLHRVLEESDGRVRLQFLGFAPSSLLALPTVDFAPYTEDYPAFLRRLSRATWSFAIAPVADLPSRRGKSDNKYREYGACRIPAVYTDCPTYSSAVVEGKTGLLVPHTEEGWYRGIRRMMSDAGLRASIARAAYEDVVGRYSVAAAAQAWFDTLQDLMARTQR